MTAILGIIALFLLLIVIYMLARTREITKEMKGEAANYDKASKVNGWLFVLFSIVMTGLMIFSAFKFIPKMLPEAASESGVLTDGMFNLTLAFTFIVFVICHIFLFYFAYKYHQRKGQKAYFFPHSNKLELIWTTLPAIVMTILVVKGVKTWLDIFQYHDGNVPANTLNVEVTGQQFKWTVRYPGIDGDFGQRIIDTPYVHPDSLNDLGIVWSDPQSHDDFFADTIYLVKGQPVFFSLGALDVLHAFYLPHFRAKMDCVPGVPTSYFLVPKYTTAEYRLRLRSKKEWQHINPSTNRPRWETFMFELACAELCGKSHFGMQKFVMVVEKPEYEAWLKRQKPVWKPHVAETVAPEMVSDTSMSGDSSNTEKIAANIP